MHITSSVLHKVYIRASVGQADTSRSTLLCHTTQGTTGLPVYHTLPHNHSLHKSKVDTNLHSPETIQIKI